MEPKASPCTSTAPQGTKALPPKAHSFLPYMYAAKRANIFASKAQTYMAKQHKAKAAYGSAPKAQGKPQKAPAPKLPKLWRFACSQSPRQTANIVHKQTASIHAGTALGKTSKALHVHPTQQPHAKPPKLGKSTRQSRPMRFLLQKRKHICRPARPAWACLPLQTCKHTRCKSAQGATLPCNSTSSTRPNAQRNVQRATAYPARQTCKAQPPTCGICHLPPREEESGDLLTEFLYKIGCGRFHRISSI